MSPTGGRAEVDLETTAFKSAVARHKIGLESNRVKANRVSRVKPILARQICRGWRGGSEAGERRPKRMDTAYSPRLHEDFGCRRTHSWDLAGKDPKDNDDFDRELRNSSKVSN